MERKIGGGGDPSSYPLGLPGTVQSAQPLSQGYLPPYSGGPKPQSLISRITYGALLLACTFLSWLYFPLL